MSDRLQKLEKAVSELSPVELKEFASWFMDFDQEIWEAEIQKDAEAGRLNFLLAEAELERKTRKLQNCNI